MKKILLSLFLIGIILYGKEDKIKSNYKSQKDIVISNNKEDKIGDNEMVSNLSKNIRPQDDFYKFVNETWENNTKIPETKPAWGSFTELSEENSNFLKNLISELKKNKNKISSDEKKIIALYNSYYNIKKGIKKDLNLFKMI